MPRLRRYHISTVLGFSCMTFVVYYTTLFNTEIENFQPLQEVRVRKSDELSHQDQGKLRNDPFYKWPFQNSDREKSKLGNWGVVPRRSTTVASRPLSSDSQHKNASSLRVLHPSSECPNLQRPAIPTDRQQFEAVNNTSSYVFSAFYDTRGDYGYVVRVVGMADTQKNGLPHYCQLWYHDGIDLKTVPLNDEIIPETHGLRYAGFIYNCGNPITNALRRMPYAVSLVESKCDVATNVLKVLPVTREDIFPQPTFFPTTVTACVPPINNKFNRVNHLLEFIEVNRMFGADKFILYTYSVGDDVLKHLKRYADEGVVTMVNWKMPSGVIVDDTHDKSGLPVDIHYYAQLVAQNDCMFRSMSQGTHVAFIDLDEVIVPRTYKSWKELLSKMPENTCSLGFRNVFFRIDYEQDKRLENVSSVRQYELRTLLTTTREVQIWQDMARSKYIALTSQIEMSGVHFPWKCRARTSYNGVNSSDALLHHYRIWGDEVKPATITDRFLHTFKDEIINRVKLRHLKVT